MKRIPALFLSAMCFILLACNGTQNKASSPSIAQSVTKLTSDSSADITHKYGWTIVSKIENKNRIYWFLAPDVNGTSPALFKKTIYTDVDSELKTKTVSECEAPKKTCEELMLRYKELSDTYR